MLNNPYGCHTQALTPAAKKTMLAQRNGRILKLVSEATLDHNFLTQWRLNNPDGLIIYRHWFGNEGDLNNLKDTDGRARAIIEAVTPVADLVDCVETGYNEEFQGINNNIRELAQAEMRIAGKIRQGIHGMKVAGGCFSVGNPANDVTKGEFQDFEAYAAAFDVLDYWAPHEYSQGWLDIGTNLRLSGRLYGSRIFRYRHVVDWAKNTGVKLPPIYLGEFGIDYGGAGQGFRRWDFSIDEYMGSARKVAPEFMQDIEDGVLAGVVFFCVGQEDEEDWGSFDLAGESKFDALLGEGFVAANHVEDSKEQGRAKALASTFAKSVTEFSQWAAEATDHDPHNKAAYLDAFLEHRERNAGVEPGTFTMQDALAGGYPQELLPDPIPKPSKLELQEKFTARRLSVPLCRVQAVYKVESNGEPFSQPGRATIRFEVHDWLPGIIDSREEWANQNFRVDRGIEQIWSGETWESVRNKDQDGRWNDLILAAQISGDLAFRWTSMGLFQILGLHYKMLHYDSARDMLQAFSHNEGAQWRAFEDFVLTKTDLHYAMITGDADTFGLIYNGNRKYGDYLRRAGWA